MGVLNLEETKNALSTADTGVFEYQTAEDLKKEIETLRNSITQNQNSGLIDSLIKNFIRTLVTDKTLASDVMKFITDLAQSKK